MGPRLNSIGMRRISDNVARHIVLPEEAEQVILNDPVDLGMEVPEGEERYLNLGATFRGPRSSRGDQMAQREAQR